jgi:hypothetical protein
LWSSEGGNKGVVKQTEDVVRYDDVNAEAPTYKEKLILHL